MVAIARTRPAAARPAAARHEATNIIRRSVRKEPPQQRSLPRAEVMVPLWLCAEGYSARGWALDLSETGARLGGVGVRFTAGETVLAKIVIDPADAPLVLKAEVVRYQSTGAVVGPSAPELCIRFIDGALDDRFRLGRFLDRQRGL